jgi:hypothetical protein
LVGLRKRIDNIARELRAEEKGNSLGRNTANDRDAILVARKLVGCSSCVGSELDLENIVLMETTTGQIHLKRKQIVGAFFY